MRNLLYELGCSKKTADEFLKICPETTQEQFSMFSNYVLENARLLLREGISLGTCLWWMIIYPDSFTRHSMFFSVSIKEIKAIAGSNDLFFLEKQFACELKVPAIEAMKERAGYREKLSYFAAWWKRYLQEEETKESIKIWDEHRKTSWELYAPFIVDKKTGKIKDLLWLDDNKESVAMVVTEEEIDELVSFEWKKAGVTEAVPIPYSGEEPYVFISYNHDDKNMVFQIIRRLQAEGYRVWYDKGIKGGAEWAKEIARRIPQCGNFISFITSNFVESDHCKDEFQWAKKKACYNSIVFLENTELEEWMDMQSCRWQRISKYDKSEEAFYRELFEIEGLERCREQKND